MSYKEKKDMSFSLGAYYNTVIIASQHTLYVTCHMRMVVKLGAFGLRVVVCSQTRIFAVLWADQNVCAHV